MGQQIVSYSVDSETRTGRQFNTDRTTFDTQADKYATFFVSCGSGHAFDGYTMLDVRRASYRIVF